MPIAATLLDLMQIAPPEDNDILRAQLRVKREPQQRRLRLGDAVRLEHAIKEVDGSVMPLGVISARVHRHNVSL